MIVMSSLSLVQIPAVMSNLTKELKSKNVKAKSRIGIFQLLKELIHAYPAALNEHIGDAVVGITTSLSVRCCISHDHQRRTVLTRFIPKLGQRH